MEDLEGSAVTSPYHAAMITSLVRALLAAAMNQLHDLGHNVYSVTTDGFITDATVDELEALDLFGLAPYFHRARLALTDGQDPSIWALKHAQDDLLNFSTRGNVSLHVGGDDSVLDGLPGVCAHNSLVTGEVKDSRADREALFRAVAARTGRSRPTKPGPPTSAGSPPATTAQTSRSATRVACCRWTSIASGDRCATRCATWTCPWTA